MTLKAAVGSIQGREHQRLWRNNQDAALAWVGADRAVAVVADGCSEGRQSEVGAQLAVRWLAAHLARAELADGSALAEETALGLLRFMERTSAELGARESLVAELLLFTFLAAVVGPERYQVFGVGDGVLAVDGAVQVLDEGSAPPYLGYRLLSSPGLPAAEVRLLAEGPASALGCLLLASDGARGLDRGALLGLAAAPVYDNPSLLTKRLRVLATARRGLWDDTTVALIQRTEEERR